MEDAIKVQGNPVKLGQKTIDDFSDEDVMKAILKGRTPEEFFESPEFVKAMTSLAKKNNVSAVEMAQNYVGQFLGSVNAVGIGTVNTVEEFVDNVLDVLYGAGKGLNKTAADLGRGVVNTITLQGK